MLGFQLVVSPPPTAPHSRRRGQRVIVETTYPVLPDRIEQSRADADELRRSRLRLGAVRWAIGERVGSPGIFVEYCTFRDWDDYAQQQTVRSTVPEHRVRETLWHHLVGEPAARVLVEPVARDMTSRR